MLEGLGEELYVASLVGKEARVGQLLKLGIDVNYVVTTDSTINPFFLQRSPGTHGEVYGVEEKGSAKLEDERRDGGRAIKRWSR